MMNTPEQQNQRTAPLLCANACGFYGNPTTKNLCSKCYRDMIREETRKHANQPSTVLSFLKETSHGLSGEQADMSIDIIPPAARTASSDDPHCSCPPVKESEVAPNESREESESSFNVCQDSEKPVSIVLLSNAEDKVFQVAYKVENRETGVVSPGSATSSSLLNKAVSESPSTQVLTATSSFEDSGSVYDVKEVNPTKPIQVNTQRCFKCSKKVGLLGFRCRCEYVFCGAHRYADGHQCMFDYKTYEREQLSKANQKIVASKINRL